MRMRMSKQARDILDAEIVRAIVQAYVEWGWQRRHYKAEEPQCTATTLVKAYGLAYQRECDVHFPEMDKYVNDGQWTQSFWQCKPEEKVTLVARRLRALARRGILKTSWGINWDGKDARMYEPDTKALIAVALRNLMTGAYCAGLRHTSTGE